MQNAVAIFPWVSIDEIYEVGPLRLLPYRKKKLPGNLPHIAQADIDGVFGAYANRPRHKVEVGTLLELGDWHAGMEAPPDIVSSLFRAKNLVAMAALCQRRLFGLHAGYCNYDTYTLVVQRYLPGETGTFSFDSRRRDGHTNQFWGSDEFMFHRPNHVEGNARMSLDKPLLEALLTLPEDHPAYEALVEFNTANTDSRDVPEHVEIVMCKSALEWIFSIKSEAKSLVLALQRVFSGIVAPSSSGPLTPRWQERWPHATRPLHAWAKDFCAVRGGAAHGMSRAKSLFVWQPHQHLAFVAMLFPLLLKKVLADEGRFALSDFDLERLRRIDDYLVHDPFDFDWHQRSGGHPWQLADSRARMSNLGKSRCSGATT